MTVASTAPTITYLENGTSTVHSVPFQFIASTDLVVERFDPDGVKSTLLLGSDYSVAGGAGSTGTVTVAVAKASGWRIRIRRATARTQPTDYTPGDRFPAESHEAALDRVTMIAQEIGARSEDSESRALRVPEGETLAALPPPAGRLSKLFGTSALGAFMLYSAQALVDLIAPFLPAALKGDPGGNAMVIGAFSILAMQLIPAGTDLIRTNGYGVGTGAGGAFYVYDAAVDAAYVAANPRTAKISLNGRGFRLAMDQPLYVEHWGAVGDGATDDTAAIQAAIDEGVDRGAAVLHFWDKTYSVTKLTVPGVDKIGASWRVLELVGYCQPSMTMGTLSGEGYAISDVGTVLKSAATKSVADDAILRVLPYAGGFSGLCLVVENMTFRTYDNPNLDGINARFAEQLVVDGFAIDTGVWSVEAAQPTHLCYGIRPPQINNGAVVRISNVAVSGYYVGLEVTEHCRYEYANAFCCLNGLEYAFAPYHSSLIAEVGLYRCPTNILVSGTHRGEIQQLRIEDAASGWQAGDYDVDDPSSLATLEIAYSVVLGNVGQHRRFTKDGGEHVTARRAGEMQPGLNLFTRTTAQSIPNNVPTPIEWGSEVLFENALLNPDDPSEIIFFEPGTYGAEVTFPYAANAAGQRQAMLAASGAVLDTDCKGATGTLPTPMHLRSATFAATAPDDGDVGPGNTGGTRLVVSTLQNSGVALSVTPGVSEGPCRITITKLRG